jgi:predicted tellurium resistance membrane protein TerC
MKGIIKDYPEVVSSGLELVGGFVVAKTMGLHYSSSDVLLGLMSVPVAIAVYMVMGKETKLTKFVKSDNTYKFIPLGVGFVTWLGTKMVTKTKSHPNPHMALQVGVLSSIVSAVVIIENLSDLDIDV